MKKLLLLSAFLFAACDGSSDPLDITDKALVRSQTFGNGVFYIPAYGGAFAQSLSIFKREHPDCLITALAPNDVGQGHGNTEGYFINCEARPAKE